MKVSIITVCLNAADVLKKTIESIAWQSYGNMEYLIIDGGSTDGSLDIIRSNSGLINRWISEKDKGIFDAMNKGIDMATGEVTAFMNAGDRYSHPDAVRLSVELFTKTGADIVYGNCSYVNGKSCWDIDYSGIHLEDYYKSVVLCHQAIFTKTSLLRTHKFDTRYKICGDYKQLLGFVSEEIGRAHV